MEYHSSIHSIHHFISRMGSFKLYSSLLLLLVAASSTFQGVWATTFTFVNKCDYTVWPGILSGASSAKLDSTGFELLHGGTRTFHAPAGWSGRFWGRTGCNFDGSGQGTCATGDCGSGQMECNGNGAAPPATLAEFTLNGSGGQDFFDVSLVDGFNLPMVVESSGGSGGCDTTGCVVDLNRRCPSELQAASGGACKSACEAFGTPEYCCSGAYGSPSTCKSSSYSQLFKTACPRAYSYAYDDATSTFTCTGADYTITFCPSSPSQKSTMESASTSTAGTTGGSVSGTGSEDGSNSGSGSAGAMLSDGSWLAKMATGNSPDTRHPSFGLQVSLLFIAITSIATSVLRV